MRSRAARVLLLSLLAAVSGCDSILNDDDEDPTFHIRSINLIEDAPLIVVALDDTTVTSVDFESSSGWTAARPGDRSIGFSYYPPSYLVDDDDSTDDDDDLDAVDAGSPILQTFEVDTDYTLIAYGTLAAPQVLALQTTGDRGDIDDDTATWRIAHAAPGLGSVDVYISAPEAEISSQYAATLNFGQQSDSQEIALLELDDLLSDQTTLYTYMTVELRTAGTDTVIYTSDEIYVAEQTYRLFTITDNHGAGPSPVKLLELSNSGSTSVRYNPNDQATLRFAHMSYDSPALDVASGSGLSELLAQNVAFRGTSADQAVASDEVGLIGVPTGNSGVFVFLEEFEASPDQYYTAYAIGPLGTVDAMLVNDDRRSVPSQTRFRFLHAASSAESEGSLSIYLTEPGVGLVFDTDGNDDDDNPTAEFSSFTYRSNTDYMTLQEGTYEAYFAVSGTTRVLLGPVQFQVLNGSVQTLVFTDSETGELELVPVEDTRD